MRHLSATLLSPLLIIASSALAQSTHMPSADDERFAVFVGYSYLSDSFNEHDTAPSHQPLNGWDTSVSARIVRGLSAKLDLSGYTGSNYSDPQHPVFVCGGGQYAFRLHRVTPFIEALAGFGHINKDFFPGTVTTSSFTAIYGGGLDFSVARHLSLRAEGGLLHTHFTIADNQIHGVPTNFGRFSTGLVLRF